MRASSIESRGGRARLRHVLYEHADEVDAGGHVVSLSLAVLS
jgi:hypothetical protein